MNKLMRIAALLLLVLVALTGCKSEDPNASEEPTASPTPTAAPTVLAPTLEPTVTPRTFEGDIEEPTAGATAMLVYPVDLPDITFTYEEISAQKINVSFQIPMGWMDVSSEDDQNRVIYQEPMTTMQSSIHVQSSIQVSVYQMQSAQTIKNAEDELNRQIDLLKDEYPGVQVTSMSNSRLMKEMGRYVSYRLEYAYDESDPSKTNSMRGRLHVTPIDRKLYIILSMHPADFNGDYDEVYKTLRESMKEL